MLQECILCTKTITSSPLSTAMLTMHKYRMEEEEEEEAQERPETTVTHSQILTAG